MLRELPARVLASGSALGPDHLARLGDLLEPAQFVIELPRGTFAEVPRQSRGRPGTRGAVVQRQVDLGAATARSRREGNVACVSDCAAGERQPRQALAGHI